MTLAEIEAALGIAATFLALVAAVLFILMVVVGELVVIARWLRRMTRMEPPHQEPAQQPNLRAGMHRW
jgi:hypothetical protein